MVKLRPHRQVSASETTHLKLTKHYYGPFEVQERLGKVAYRLKLPAHSRIHLVFHVSLLKAFVGDPKAAHADPLPVMGTEEEATNTPLMVIDSKLVPADNGPRRMVLVQWPGSSRQDASWEDWQVLRERYNLEDKVWSEERGDDTHVEEEAMH